MTTTAPPQDPVAALWNDLRGYLTESRQHLDQIARVLRDNGSPAVLETATVAIPAAGVYEKSYRIPYASVMVVNPSTSPVYVTSAAGQASVPGNGMGLVIVPAGAYVAVNLSGQTISIYGPATTTVTFSVMTSRIQPSAGTVGTVPVASIFSAGNATAPAALATITSATLPPGSWSVAWSFMFGGTPGVAEVNNLYLQLGPVIVASSLNGDTALTPYPQLAQTLITTAPTVLGIHATNAGTAGAIYYVQFTASPLLT